MKRMASRKRHSAEDIVRADELNAEGRTGEEIAAEAGVSLATLYTGPRVWRKALREQDARLRRRWPGPSWSQDALRGLSERLARRAVGLDRYTPRRLTRNRADSVMGTRHAH